MKKILLLFVPIVSTLTSCHFENPVYTEVQSIDKELSGIWEHDEGSMIIIPIDHARYVIQSPREQKASLYYLGSIVGENLIQLKVLATSDEVPGKIERAYTVAYYALAGDKLTYRVIEQNKIKAPKTPKNIRRQIESSGQDLFSEETLTFRRKKKQ